jgi:beta-phosphoglucomutase
MSAAFAGAIFDVDGVLVDTPHERAWREALEDLMEGDWRGVPSTWTPGGFTTRVYQRLVAASRG